MTNYEEILQVLPALIEDNTYDITILSNTSALLFEHLEQINWVGFYMNKNNALFLGPFQGKVACTIIPLSKGVCGACASTLKTILVPNVHEFKGHIACDSASNSEICIPILVHNELYAILDIDSPILNRFTKEDQKHLESIASIISMQLEKL
ncbi:MAG: GAF domain-containing protein [Anaeroplasmataceae bacterium]|nr:GAF domain-containing protein [Anaeroplasmataceae bacterium]MDE6414809.1 GAF domain-containing protein [Anaeroplasmataceae bacterium]